MLLDANRRLFNQLEFVRTKSAEARTETKSTMAADKARQDMALLLKGKAYSEFDFNELGVEAFSEGNYDLALALFNNSVVMNPKFHEGFTNMGVVYLALGQYENAIIYFRRALRIDPGFATAKNYLKQAESSLKQENAAREDNKKRVESAKF